MNENSSAPTDFATATDTGFVSWVEARYGPECLAKYQELQAIEPMEEPMVVLESAVLASFPKHYEVEAREFGAIRCDSP